MGRIPKIEELITRTLLALALVATLFALTLLAARPAHAAEFEVDSTADTDTRACTAATSNDCTLRGAINRSNASTNEDDTISFDIPASACNATTGVCTITPTTQLPSLTDKVRIDGYTQDGASENNEDDNTNNAELKIELNGKPASDAAAGGGTIIPGLVVNGPGASGTVIRGLVINRYSLHGVFIDAGATATVEGNFIGTDPTGQTDLGNGFDGVLATSSNNRIGGAANGAQNVISGNGRDGVSLAGTEATGNVIINNHIGTDADAIDPLGNTRHGVSVFSADTLVGGNDKNSANGAGDDGTAQGEGNIISGNGGHGVLVDNVFAEGTKIQGNHIGVDRNGSGNDLGNTLDGVRVSSAPQVEVGGATDGLGNTISKNGQHGVEVVGTSSTLVKVQGNRIGTNYIVSDDKGNGQSGVRVETSGNFIGTDANGFNDASEGNTIAFNTQQGVIVVGATATGNRVLRNSISDNGQLGIELNSDGVTANDTRDPDPGPNNLQNFPTITSATTTTIKGALNSTPNTTFAIQLFSSPQSDASGFGEGEQLIAEQTVTTSANKVVRKKKKKKKRKKKVFVPGGNAAFEVVLPTATAGVVMATATRTDTGDTSEFSQARLVQ